MRSRPIATLLAAVSFALGGASAGAQGTTPVIPPRPHTTLQLMGTMQVPWTVSIRPATNYVAIGQCLAVYIDLFDASAKDIPRNSLGQRVTLADFDWTATGNTAVGKYDGPNAWAVCACPAAAVGSTIHVMATYPAASLPEKAKVPGLAFKSYIELPITPAKGTNSPAGCDNVLVTTTVATSVPGGAQPPTVLPPHGQPPAANSGTPGATTPLPTAPTGPYQGTPLPLPPVELAPAQTPPAQTPPAQTPPVSAPPAPPSATPATPPASTPAATTGSTVNVGYYRVVATGFRVLHQTKDDVLSRDGHGDEIYGGFMTFRYNRQTSKLVDNPSFSATNIIGEGGYDGYSFNYDGTAPHVTPRGRLRGGTAAPDGGFAQNDVFPAVADPSQRYGVAPTRSTFPFLIFAGALTDGQEAVIVEPTLWEADGSHDGFDKWHNYESNTSSQIWSDPAVQAAVNGTQLALISPSGALETSFGLHMNSGDQFGIALAPLLGPFAFLNSGSYDRPIGVFVNGVPGLGGIASGPVLPRRAIVITREIVEAALAKQATYNPATVVPSLFQIYGGPPVMLPVPPPGTIAVQLFEKPDNDLQAMYILYIKVERVACESANCIYAP